MVKLALHALLCLFMLPATAAQDLLLESELDVPEVHVHAEAVYRLRFLHAVDVREVQIHGPAVRLADLRRIGEDRIYETQREGKRYRVHERRYALFPFAGGMLTLSGAHVTGRVPAAGDSLPHGWRPIRLETPPRTLTVLPADIQADGAPWLPANALTLTEQWTAAENGVHRRTVRIEASGVDAAQLPELDVQVEGMGVLPGPPRLHNSFAGERNLAVREQTFVLMPTRGGPFSVPPLQLRWWNVETDSGATATLPSRTLVGGEHFAPADTADGSSLQRMTPGHVWVMPAAVFGALLLFASVRRQRLRTAWRLRRACRTGDARAVRDGLLEWTALILPDPPSSLGALAERMQDASARGRLAALERHLYGPQEESWSNGAFRALVASVKRDIGRNLKHHLKRNLERDARRKRS